jgi:hypothetical protein
MLHPQVATGRDNSLRSTIVVSALTQLCSRLERVLMEELELLPGILQDSTCKGTVRYRFGISWTCDQPHRRRAKRS